MYFGSKPKTTTGKYQPNWILISNQFGNCDENFKAGNNSGVVVSPSTTLRRGHHLQHTVLIHLFKIVFINKYFSWEKKNNLFSFFNKIWKIFKFKSMSHLTENLVCHRNTVSLFSYIELIYCKNKQSKLKQFRTWNIENLYAKHWIFHLIKFVLNTPTYILFVFSKFELKQIYNCIICSSFSVMRTVKIGRRERLWYLAKCCGILYPDRVQKKIDKLKKNPTDLWMKFVLIIEKVIL